MKQVLTEKNPYTGIPLAQDPALAIIQIQNEDSLLFWTSQGIKGSAKKELRRQFGEFLAKKYGSLEKARQAWGGAAPSPDQDAPDDFAQRRGGPVHHLAIDAARRQRRASSSGAPTRCSSSPRRCTPSTR